MKVLPVNGSSRKNGCTKTALSEVERALNEEGVETEIFYIGNEALPDYIACRKCREIDHRVFNDIVNEFVEKAKSADGFIFGSPVYYAHPSGRLLTFIFLVWYFRSIVVYVLISAVLAVMGNPLVKRLAALHVKGWKVPRWLDRKSVV